MPDWNEDEASSRRDERLPGLGVRRAVLGGVAGVALLVGPVGLANAVVPGEGSDVEAGDDRDSLMGALATSTDQVEAMDRVWMNQALAAQEATAGAKPAAPTTTSSTTTTSTTSTTSPTDEVDPPPDSGGGVGDPTSYATWDALAECESGGNWSINTGNGYYGGVQFSLSTWQAVGGTGYPHEHSRETQIHFGQVLQARAGWGQWPHCASQLGWI